jgi:hypothetical protein
MRKVAAFLLVGALIVVALPVMAVPSNAVELPPRASQPVAQADTAPKKSGPAPNLLTQRPAGVIQKLLPPPVSQPQLVHETIALPPKSGLAEAGVSPLEHVAPAPASSMAEIVQVVSTAAAEPEPLLQDKDLLAAAKKAALRGLTRQVEEYDELQSVLAWNNYLGRIIFVVVHGILAMALVISWREFQAARETRAEAKSKKRRANEESPAQEEVSASLEGIALKTSRHGTLILLVAFAFYVAYLKFVYPVQIIPG